VLYDPEILSCAVVVCILLFFPSRIKKCEKPQYQTGLYFHFVLVLLALQKRTPSDHVLHWSPTNARPVAYIWTSEHVDQVARQAHK
jgi:hypothetical protein